MERHITTLRGEAALAAAVFVNSFGVVLMLYSGAGISAISSALVNKNWTLDFSNPVQ